MTLPLDEGQKHRATGVFNDGRHVGCSGVPTKHKGALVLPFTGKMVLSQPKMGAGSEGGSMALEKELETYKAKLPELKGHEGKFALIHGEELVDTYSSYEDAMKEGYSKYGVKDPFLVKQIQAIEQIHFISRFVEPCTVSR
jgi:hypothetical protein